LYLVILTQYTKDISRVFNNTKALADELFVNLNTEIQVNKDTPIFTVIEEIIVPSERSELRDLKLF